VPTQYCAWCRQPVVLSHAEKAWLATAGDDLGACPDSPDHLHHTARWLNRPEWR
jgi:hypothetical protein